MNTTAFPSPRGFRVSNRFLANALMPRTLKTRRPHHGSNDVSRANRQYSTLGEGRRLAASEIADQASKSRWLRIQRVNHVFALALTIQCVRRSYVYPRQLV